MNNKRKSIALILWWCEGTKVRKDNRWKNAYLYPIELTNTDSKIIKIFKDFLVQDLEIPNNKLRAQIQIHVGDNQEEMEKYWSRITGISINQFNKTIIRPKGTRFRKNHGTFKIRLYDKKIFIKLQKMLNIELRKINY